MNTARRFLSLPFWGAAVLLLIAGLTFSAHAANSNVHITRHWHLHQPVYWPEWNTLDGQVNRYQFAWDSVQIKASGGNMYSGSGVVHPQNVLVNGDPGEYDRVFDLDDRIAAYQDRPKNSLSSLSYPNAGYSMSYSGALMENIGSLGRHNAYGYTSSWNSHNTTARSWTTSGGKTKLDLVNFTYHHSFGPLIPKSVLRKEIQIFKEIWWKTWGGNSDKTDQSKGFWPAEAAFSPAMIDVLVDEGIEWSIVANSHLSRTCQNFDNVAGLGNTTSNIDPPNRADRLGPTIPADQWWSGSQDGRGAWQAAPFAYQAHRVKYVNPSTGVEKSIVVVPMDDVMSYLIGYAPLGRGLIDSEISPFATDASHPSIVLLSTDGENSWGGGSTSWMEATPGLLNDCGAAGYDPTTIQQFISDHPVPESDVVHIEDGSWFNAANDWGHPQFINWLYPPVTTNTALQNNPYTRYDFETPGWAEDFRNWAILMAGANWVETAEQIWNQLNPSNTVQAWRIQEPYQTDGTYNNPLDVELAWHIFLGGFDSGFMYYGISTDDEVKQTLAANRAIAKIQSYVQSNLAQDSTPPTVFKPQRFPWNPGGRGWGPLTLYQAVGFNDNDPWPSDFYVWSHIYDVSGVSNVNLKVRVDTDGVNTLSNNQNETYAGGADVGGWASIPMSKRVLDPMQGNNGGNINFFLMPTAMADYYFAKVVGYRNVLLDYYIEATDAKGNIFKSDIQHVFVEDDGTQGGVGPSATFSPAAPSDCAPFTVLFNATTSVLATATTVNAFYHFSTNGTDWTNAVMTRATSNTFTLTFATVPDNAPQLEICFTDGVNWENNGGDNWMTTIRDCDAPEFVDGVCILPGVPTAGSSVSVIYDPTGRALAAATNVNIHYGYNNSNWTVAPGTAMVKSNVYWTYGYTIPVAATSIVMCFNNGSTWDNNSSANWTFAVNPTSVPPVPNGVVITNPAVATTTVANAVASYALQGTAGTNLTGNLLWTNSASRQGGSFTRATYWSHSFDLAVGDNAITLSAVLAGTGAGATTNASDSASHAAYSGGWTNGSNGGTGFGAWTLFHDANAGHFVTNSGWGLWSHEGTNLSEAVRTLSPSLSAGQTFRVRMQNGWIWESGGSIGVALRDSEGSILWQLYFNGGHTNYDTTTGPTDIAWTDAGIDIAFTVTDANAYSVDVQPVGGSLRQYTGTFSGQIAQFRAWSSNNGTSDTNNFHRDYFVNNLGVTSMAGDGESYSTATVHVVREASGAPLPVIAGMELQGGGGRLGFSLGTSVSGATYAIWASPTLFPSQNWQKVAGTESNAGGGPLDLTITNGLLPTNFYRVGYGQD